MRYGEAQGEPIILTPETGFNDEDVELYRKSAPAYSPAQLCAC
jgi:hypothetical protein